MSSFSSIRHDPYLNDSYHVLTVLLLMSEGTLWTYYKYSLPDRLRPRQPTDELQMRKKKINMYKYPMLTSKGVPIKRNTTSVIITFNKVVKTRFFTFTSSNRSIYTLVLKTRCETGSQFSRDQVLRHDIVSRRGQRKRRVNILSNCNSGTPGRGRVSWNDHTFSTKDFENEKKDKLETRIYTFGQDGCVKIFLEKIRSLLSETVETLNIYKKDNTELRVQILSLSSL